MSEKSQQIKQENKDQVNSLLPMIEDYKKKFTNYKNYILWNNTMLIEWEFYFLSDNGIIGRQGIKRPADYSYFMKAKNLLAQKYNNQRFAKRVNTPPEPEQ